MVDAVVAVYRTEKRYQFLSEVVNSQKLRRVAGVAPLMGVNVEPLAVVTVREGVAPMLEAGALPSDGVIPLNNHITLESKTGFLG